MTIMLFLLLTSNHPWPWAEGSRSIAGIAAPQDFTRVSIDQGSFAEWLRNLPLKPRDTPVRHFDGRIKPNQEAHTDVVDIDTGSRDLQQCADAVMRLRAEYLFANNQDVAFNFTSGDRASWRDWREGQRPVVKGNHVSWRQNGSKDHSYSNFRRYLNIVFAYAGTHSLKKEMGRISDPGQIQAGDVFIQGGFPGHAVLVVDVAENKQGERVFLLVQSYMPAQDIHVLRGPIAGSWYPARSVGVLKTPEWTFDYGDLRRF